MLSRAWLIALAAAGLLAACASSDDREWMKVNERYSVEDFRRDHAACSKSGKLDDACMRSRGWVDVRSSATDKAPELKKRGTY
ncbi:MAG: hypothetical protein HYR51_16965 [Candidatus Rokubacteria bacterium]|nr:hypothetical protein [Candidatus Rokubacteria bacterium]